MRQISLRQEAGRLGGIGTCGRELCCSTWLTDFKGVATSAARYQNLSLNPSKLSGQCGRLKCCLNYELDTYLHELKDIPKVDKDLQTEKGYARLQKTDIFRKVMWFAYSGDESNWIKIDISRVTFIIEQNKKGVKPQALTEEEEFIIEEAQSEVKNEDLIALDKKFSKNKKKKKPSSGSRQGGQPSGGGNRPSSGPRPQGNQGNSNPASAAPNPNRPPSGNQPRPNQGGNRPPNPPKNNTGNPQNQPRPNPSGGNPPNQPRPNPQGGNPPRPEGSANPGQNPNQGKKQGGRPNNRNRGNRENRPPGPPKPPEA
jgi:hypothetical protein